MPVSRTAASHHARVVAAVAVAIGIVSTMAALTVKGDLDSLATVGSIVAVGAVICWKRPDERVGGLLIAASLLYGISTVVFWSVSVVNASSQPPPIAVFAAWLDEWAWIPMLTTFFVVLPMLLPDGRPTSRAFGRLLRLIVVVMAGWTLVAMFSARLADELGTDSPGIVSPVGFLPLDDVENPPTGWYLLGTFAVSMVIAAVSLVVRYRRSKGRERAQLRWIALGALASIFGFVAVARLEPLVPVDIDWAFAVVIPLMPLSIGVAVLRHNLYDIDRLISRTVAYGAVTALLLVCYLALVVVLRAAVPVHGDLAIAASTLAVAAVFNPLRQRVQRIVDRRFNRARYDAACTVEMFAERLRTQFDVAALAEDLEAVVVATMQPTAMSIWLRTQSATDNAAEGASVSRRPAALAVEARRSAPLSPTVYQRT